MSDMQDTTIIEAPPEPVVTDPDPGPQPEPEVEAQPEWAKRFPGGPDDVYKSFREAETRMTQEAQRAKDLERQLAEYQQQQEAYADPWDALPPTIDEGTQAQLAAWAQRDPAQAAQWAYENHHTVGPEVAGQLYQYWASRDFWGAENWKAQIVNQQYYAQMEQKIRGEYEPMRQHTTAQMSQLTIDLAQRAIPDWDAWAPRIVEFLEKPENKSYRESIDAAGLGSEGAAERLYDIYAVLHARDQRARGSAPQPQPAPSPSAHTETSSTGQPRDDGGRYASQTTTTPTSGRRTGRLDHL